MERRHFRIHKHIVALLLAGALLLYGPVARAQVADSLARLLAKGTEDTSRVLLLTDYAWEINETRTDEAEQKLREAVALAQRLKFLRGEAAAWNGLGVVEELRGNWEQAQSYYRKALSQRQSLGNINDITNTLNNLAVLYEMSGRLDSAIVLHKENLRLLEPLNDTVRIARAHFNIAGAYMEMGLYNDANEFLTQARMILEARKDLDGTAKVYTQLGHVRFELDLYEDARLWYRKALKMREQQSDPVRLAEAYSDYANALDEVDSSQTAVSYYLRALDIWKQLDDLPGQSNVFINLGDAHKHLGNYSIALQYLRLAEKICLDLDDKSSLMETYNTIGDVFYRDGKYKNSLEYVRRYLQIARKTGDEKFLQGAYKDFAEVYSAMGNFRKAYEYRALYDEVRYKNLNEKMIGFFAQKEALFEDDRRKQQLKKQEADLKLQQSELARSRTELYASLAGVLALLILAALLFSRNRLRARANRELAAKNDAIEQERRRADDLLANILPAATAAELKAHARVKPVRYESVTVMFTDFKGFTTIAETMPSEILIAELDECFSLFDNIMHEFGLEKIKTIGDAYMCAGGLPMANDTHPQDVVRAAIAMQCRLQILMEQKKAAGKPLFEMRIGIHTGPVVAGVVGRHKFAYDIWGDTVNTAARLEQGGEPLKINISETTYQAVKAQFPCTYRGRLSAKNKGEVAMYFVEYER
ncbi:MAG: tetratricopeptide repeat protein [Lewinellaceae bacterium]|nr:tetratricopeptide repeat protein [Lewinellaceae bacterium]